MLTAVKQLLTPPRGMDIDFTQPTGAEALISQDGVSWEVFANPLSLYIGGIVAVLLELAEPSVGSGVWDHSSFKTDTYGRLQRTGHAAMIAVFAPKQDAARMIARVVKMHEQVKGINYLGEPYYANDPQLLNWVQATAFFGFSTAFDHYIRPLNPQEKDLVFIEGQASARLFGATNTPHSWQEWEQFLQRMQPRLQDSQIVHDFVEVMQHADILPKPFKWIQKLMIKAAVEISPPHIQNFPSLKGLRLNPAEKILLKSLAITTKLLPLDFMPPAQARRRMNA